KKQSYEVSYFRTCGATMEMEFIDYKLENVVFTILSKPSTCTLKDLRISPIPSYLRRGMSHHHDGQHTDVSNQNIWWRNLHFPAVKQFRSIRCHSPNEIGCL